MRVYNLKEEVEGRGGKRKNYLIKEKNKISQKMANLLLYYIEKPDTL